MISDVERSNLFVVSYLLPLKKCQAFLLWRGYNVKRNKNYNNSRMWKPLVQENFRNLISKITYFEYKDF